MLKKIGLIKDLSAKLGKRRTMEFVNLIEGDESFEISIKIKKQGVSNKKDIITLKDGQQVIIEYSEI